MQQDPRTPGKPAAQESAKRRDRTIAQTRADRASGRMPRPELLPSAPATGRKRSYLAKLRGQLGQPPQLAPGLTNAQASRQIARARVELTRAKLNTPCPVCHAAPGEPCAKRNGKPRHYLHANRAPNSATPDRSTRGST